MAIGEQATMIMNDEIVKETTSSDFRKDVILESMDAPVLVDFWAPWCGPCKQLAPVIEKVVKATGGKAKLVKMNIDQHPEIAGQLGIQSIPAVIAFQRGQPVDGFMGALPEGQVKSFVERLVGPLTDEGEEKLARAEAALERGDSQEAEQIYGELLSRNPPDQRAAAALVELQTSAGQFERARQTLSLVDEPYLEPKLAAAKTALDLAVEAASLGDVSDLSRRVAANPGDYAARFDLSLVLNSKGERAAAAELLLEIIRRDRSWREDGARKQLVQFFEAWGPADPATAAARRKLSALLFS